jgi:hypothetical protein
MVGICFKGEISKNLTKLIPKGVRRGGQYEESGSTTIYK